MAKQIINTGTTGNDGTGDPLRTALGKVNLNFTEVYDDVATIKLIVGSGISDADTVVDTLSEMLTVFQTYSEGVDIATQIASKQSTLVSGTTLKTFGGVSLLGAGDIPSSAGGSATVKKTGFAYVDVAGSNATGVVNDAAKPFLTLDAAYSALPAAGGVIAVGVGVFSKLTTITKPISIIGCGVPSPDWTITQANLSTVTRSNPTKLLGGTVIKGGMDFLSLSNIKIFNLGIDVGSEYVLGGGTVSNGLGFANSTNSEQFNTPSPSYVLVTGIEIRNVICLLPNANSLFHGFVAENTFGMVVENLTTIFGVHGVAIKTTKAHLKNINCFNHGVDGIIVKSNNYSVTSQNVIDGFNINDCATGIILEAKNNATFRDVKICNGYINGGTNAVNVTKSNNQEFFNCVFDNVTVRGVSANYFMLSTNYVLKGCFAEDTYIDNTAVASVGSGTGVDVIFGVTDGSVFATGTNWNTTSTDGLYGHLATTAQKLNASTNGGISSNFLVTADSGGVVFGLNTASSLTIYQNMEVGWFVDGANNLNAINNGSITIVGTIVTNRYYRIKRVGANYTLESSPDNSTWSLVYNYSYTGTSEMYPVVDIAGGAGFTLRSPKLFTL